MGAGLRALPLSAQTVHLCVDMQLIFSEGPWATPWMERVLPAVEANSERFPDRTVFARFITPEHAEDMPGRWWRRYITRHGGKRRAISLTSGSLNSCRPCAGSSRPQPSSTRRALFGLFRPCPASTSSCPPGGRTNRDRLRDRRLRVGNHHGGS